MHHEYNIKSGFVARRHIRTVLVWNDEIGGRELEIFIHLRD